MVKVLISISIECDGALVSKKL